MNETNKDKQANYMVVLARGPEYGSSVCSIHETLEEAEQEAKRQDAKLTEGERLKLRMKHIVMPLSGNSTYTDCTEEV